jgi:glucose/arabinose dehydrogenase
MLTTLTTLAFTTGFLCLGIWGTSLIRRNDGRRLFGAVLVLEAALLLSLQVILSTYPLGIGDPLIRVRFWNTLAQSFASIVVVALVAGSVWWIAQRLTARRQPRFWPCIVLASLLVPLMASAGFFGLIRVSTPERERERDPNKRTITLPQGFAWNVYLHGTIDNPTTIAFGPRKELYVADISGTLWVARDGNQDGTTEQIDRFADGFSLLIGLVWHKGELYAASSGKIEALRDSDGDNIADERRVVVSGLPSMVLKPHSNNGLAIGPDGRLYFGVGSTTDGEVEQEQYAAAVLSVNTDGTDLRVFARGFGNTFDVAFNAAGELFGGDNSPQGADDPPDEFNHIVQDGHYGFPYFYGDPPENGGTRGALVSFPPHSVPTGVTFYEGSHFPAEYHDGAFVTLWNSGEIARIEVGRTGSGNYLGRVAPFGSGFLWPIDAITGPDGNLYVADFGTSTVYRITYDPNKAW